MNNLVMSLAPDIPVRKTSDDGSLEQQLLRVSLYPRVTRFHRFPFIARLASR